MRARTIASAFAVLCAVAAQAPAQVLQVPADRQAKLLLKVLSYDNKLVRAGRRDLRVAVVYDPGDAVSMRVAGDVHAALKALKGATIKSLPVQAVLVPWAGRADLTQRLRRDGVGSVYLAPGMDGKLGMVADICGKLGVITVTGVRRYVTQGAAVAISLDEANRPRVAINPATSAAQGSEFSSQIYRVAELVR